MRMAFRACGSAANVELEELGFSSSTFTTEYQVEIQFLRITWTKLLRVHGGCLGAKRR